MEGEVVCDMLIMVVVVVVVNTVLLFVSVVCWFGIRFGNPFAATICYLSLFLIIISICFTIIINIIFYYDHY